jgi:hypothetical protein
LTTTPPARCLPRIEASKNNPNWGLLWVDGTTAFAGLDQQGLLQKGFEPNVTWDSLGTQSLPPDKSAAGQALGSNRDDDVAYQPGISP